MKKWTVYLGVAVTALMLSACGGGSDTDDALKSVSESDRVALKSEDTGRIAKSLNGLGAFGDINIKNMVPSNKIVSASLKVTGVARQTEQRRVSCDQGGSAEVTGDESSGSIVFSQCAMNGVTIDGKIDVKSESENRGSITVEELTVSVADGNKIYLGKFSISGAFEEDVYGDIEPTSLSISGYGYAQTAEDRLDFRLRKYSFVDKGSNVEISLDVSLKTACLGGWIEIATPETIVAKLGGYDESLEAGKVVISGNHSKITIEAMGDDKVKFTDVEGSTKTYDHLNEMENELTEEANSAGCRVP